MVRPCGVRAVEDVGAVLGPEGRRRQHGGVGDWGVSGDEGARWTVGWAGGRQKARS